MTAILNTHFSFPSATLAECAEAYELVKYHAELESRGSSCLESHFNLQSNSSREETEKFIVYYKNDFTTEQIALWLERETKNNITFLLMVSVASPVVRSLFLNELFASFEASYVALKASIRQQVCHAGA